MQTRLRIVSLLFVACLLWISPTFAANRRPKRETAQKVTPRYTGTASWYGIDHQGRKMANGQRFDRHKFTAACWFLPFGTVVRVVNLENGKAVQVTITDRGPHIRLNRVLDLSEAAARELDFIGQGLTSVFFSPVVLVHPQPAELEARLIEPWSEVPAPEETASNISPGRMALP